MMMIIIGGVSGGGRIIKIKTELNKKMIIACSLPTLPPHHIECKIIFYRLARFLFNFFFLFIFDFIAIFSVLAPLK